MEVWSDTSVFRVINLATDETLQTILINELDQNDDIIYSNGQIYKSDDKSVALYDEKNGKFNQLNDKLQEKSRYPNYVGVDEECYVKNRIMINNDGKAIVIRAILEYGDCRECIIQRLLLR